MQYPFSALKVAACPIPPNGLPGNYRDFPFPVGEFTLQMKWRRQWFRLVAVPYSLACAGCLGVPAVELGDVYHGFHVFRIGFVEGCGRHDKTAVFTAYCNEVSAIVLDL